MSAANESGSFCLENIDASVHFSEMKQVWERIFNIPKESIFVTLHSKECLDGLKCFLIKNPNSLSDVAVYRIRQESSHPISYMDDDLMIALEQDIEIR